MSSVLLLRNSWCCFKQTCSNPESVHAVDRSFHTLVVRNESELWGRRVLRSCNRAQHGKACVPHAFATNGKLVYFVVQHWVWISVTEWIKTQLPQKFTPTLTFSLNLIQDLLFLIVIWERQLKQIKAVTSLWTNHTDFVQWKKTLFGFVWSDDLVTPSSDHNFGLCVCSSRILLRPTVSSSFPSVHLCWTTGVGPPAVFVFGVFSVSAPLLCYRNVPSGQGRK